VTRFRFRWRDPRADDATVPWVYPSVLLATLFLNAAFWFGAGPEFTLHGPAVWYFVQVIGGAVLLTVLFYLGPALASQTAKRSLFELADGSLGSIGSFGLRACCTAFLTVWLGEQLDVIARLLLPLWSYRPESATFERIAICVLGLLLCWTGLQNLRTTARLAFFTNKLGVALLVVALVRVREGWPVAWHALAKRSWLVDTPDLWRGLAQLSFWAAPLVFLASDFGRRCPDRRQVNFIGLFGIALPAAGTLLILGFIEQAAHGAGASTQGIANIGSALFHGDSGRYFEKFMAILAISMFGATRYGVSALAGCQAIFSHRFVCWTLLCLAVCTTGVIAPMISLGLSSVLNPLARCLVAAAAVLSADFLTGRSRAASSSRINWVGAAALLIGWGLPYLPGLFLDTGYMWWNPWLLRTYIVAFSICLLGGVVGRLSRGDRNTTVANI